MPDTPKEWIEGESYRRLIYFQNKLNKRPPRSEQRFENHIAQALKGLHTHYEHEQNKIIFSSQDRACPTRGKGYLVDFYFNKLKLGFEVDGQTHDSEHAKTYDAVRDSFIATKGIKIVRVKNEDTLNPGYCIRLIQRAIKDRKYQLAQRKRIYKGKRSNVQAKAQTIDEYLADGGTITKCPPAEKKYKNKYGKTYAVKIAI